MKGMSTAPTLKDVAREAGVSLATASRSLNGSERTVHEEYRTRVLAAAARLGYTPNLSAQAVARGASMTIGLVVADIADPYFSSIAAGVIDAADEAGLIVTMSATGHDPTRELAMVRALRGQRLRVLIIAGSRLAADGTQPALSAELAAFESTGGRVVLVSQPELPFDTVLLDNYGGANQLADALFDLGYRRFAVLSGSPQLLSASDRVAGFTDALAGHGVTISTTHIVHAAFTRDGGYEGAKELLHRGVDDVELVFAVNDVMAMGAMSALREAGCIPGQTIAVAGYDDIPTVRDVTPALTTVRIPLEEIGRRAVRLALAPRSDRAGVAPISATVILRGSTPVLSRTDRTR